MGNTTKTVTSVEIAPGQVLDTIRKHMLVDGFPIVVDLKKSKGARLVDEADGRSYLDFFQFFASATVGFNHPRMLEDDFLNKLTTAAVNKPSNSDFYSTSMAEGFGEARMTSMSVTLARITWLIMM